MAIRTDDIGLGERLTLAVDFAVSLAAGDALISDNVEIFVTNALTDADATDDVLVAGSLDVTGTVVTCQVVGFGSIGDAYLVEFSSGLTQDGDEYHPKIMLQVVEETRDNALLASRNDIKLAAGVALNDTSLDDRFDQLVQSCSEYLRLMTGRAFALRRRVETIVPMNDPRDGFLQVSGIPLLRVEQVVLTYNDGLDEEVIDEADLRFLPDGRIWRKDGGGWLEYPNVNTVTYRYGEILVPDLVREACVKLATMFHRLAGTEGFTMEQVGDYVYRKQPLAALAPILARGGVPDETNFVNNVIQKYTLYGIAA